MLTNQTMCMEGAWPVFSQQPQPKLSFSQPAAHKNSISGRCTRSFSWEALLYLANHTKIDKDFIALRRIAAYQMASQFAGTALNPGQNLIEPFSRAVFRKA